MSLLPVRRNNFIKSEKSTHIDGVSKFLISGLFILGLNRTALFGKTKFHIASALLYTIVIQSALITFAYVLCYPSKYNKNFTLYIKLVRYLFCCIFGFVTCRKVHNYYRELEKCDMKLGCRPQNKRASIKLMLEMTCVISVTTFTVVAWYSMDQTPFKWLQIFENYYHAHLVNLLTNRLGMLNFFIDASLKNKLSTKHGITLVHLKNEEVKDVKTSELMDSYFTVIDAYDLLSEAMKLQLLVMITVTFLTSLAWSYEIAVSFLREDIPLSRCVLGFVSVIVTELVPVAAPCMACDGVRAEVARLRELLSSQLHECKHDKSNRSVSRAFLKLTETRNLSFSLFRMLDISISLPFSFLGLLATYLIIMLQFEKVIYQKNI